MSAREIELKACAKDLYMNKWTFLFLQLSLGKRCAYGLVGLDTKTT